MSDILERIDAALDGHDDLVFADAMASVRDLLDGSDVFLGAVQRTSLSCAQYVAPENRQPHGSPSTTPDPNNRYGWIGHVAVLRAMLRASAMPTDPDEVFTLRA